MVFGMETRLKFIFEQIASVARTVDKFFLERMTIFFKRIAQAVRTDDNYCVILTPKKATLFIYTEEHEGGLDKDGEAGEVSLIS